MTSFAFILGVLPLILSRGAGAEMRRTLGTAVFSGMIGVTLFGLMLTPVFFFTIDWLAETRMFHSRAAQLVSRISLDVLTLGLLRVAALASRRTVPRPQRESPVHSRNAVANGDGKAHAPQSEETAIRREADVEPK
jgi:multidrug efflux pump